MNDSKPVLDDVQKREIYELLVRDIGANPDLKDYFVRIWPDCREFRISGKLGFGGKVWRGGRTGNVYVTCYPEDSTPERDALIQQTNRRIEELLLWVPGEPRV